MGRLATAEPAPIKYVISFTWPEDKKRNAGNASRSLKDVAPSFGRGMRIADSEENARVAKYILEKYGAIVKVQKLEELVPIQQPAKGGPPSTQPVKAQITYSGVRNIDKDVQAFQDRLTFLKRRNNFMIVQGTRDSINDLLLQLHKDGGKDIRMEFI